jgi:purine-binding chemotaxis protein CheW
MTAMAAEPEVPQLDGQLVVFTFGEEEYALPIGAVQEIIRYSQPRSINSQIHWLRGVISLRGKIIPVCDLAARLGVVSEQGSDTKIVIVDTEAGTAGVIVDGVNEVLTVTTDQLDAAPGAGTDFIDAIAKVDSRLIVLLNPQRMLAEVTGAVA